MKRRRLVATLLLALTLFLTVSPSGEAVTVPVYDYINWLLSWYQRGQQIYNQGRQIYYQVKSLERLGQAAHWDSLQGMLAWLDQVMRGGDHLGYLVGGLEGRFAETFPDQYQTRSWTADSRRRIDRTRSTLQKLMAVLNRITWANTRSQETVADLVAQSAAADTPLKAQESTNGWLNAMNLELQKMKEAQLATANAVTVYSAFEMHREAVAETARNDWIGAQLPPPLEPDRRFFSAVPRGL
jgi:P-type conjugative transfer protein TrbJ